MAGKPAARVGDPTACPLPGHGTNPIAAGSADVLYDGMPAARQGDPTACGSALVGNVIPTVLINSKPATTLGTLGSHGNVVIGGSGTVIIGSGHTPAPFTAPAPLILGGALQAATLASSGPVARQPSHDSPAEPWQEQPGDPAPLGLEEEEEEEEELQDTAQQAVTLRIGVFFDGTGNNKGNSETVAACYAEDADLAAAAEDIRAHCAAYGYDGKGSSPDNSYGNDVSNVVRLYELYVDQVDESLSADAKEASLRIYIEGIGTSSGQEDSLYSQATGLGEMGVAARAEQAPAFILEQIHTFLINNPELIIEQIEFDIFGFSRGAAAARHFVNELFKGQDSALVKELAADSKGFAERFAWRPKTDVVINFLGLFDTVAAIANPWLFDFSGANAFNPGIDLCLTADCAKKVVQLVARDEVRQNFALNSAGSVDIVLPGVHSDLGGGYLPRATEKLLLSKPRASNVSQGLPATRSPAYLFTSSEQSLWANKGLVEADAAGAPISIALWGKNLDYDKKSDSTKQGPQKRVFAAVSITRPVRGELSLVYLRIMRELAVKNGVPFKPIDEHEPKLALPAELKPIAAKLQTFALGDSPNAGLTPAEEALLRQRYIHLSAHWNAAKGHNSSDLEVVFINRPTANNKRVVHPNE